MDEREMLDLTRERAAKRAPPPLLEPLYAGCLGACIAALPVMSYIAFARIPHDSHPMVLAIALGLGFVIPYGYLRNQQRLHDRAWVKEYAALRNKQAQRIERVTKAQRN